MQVDLDFTDIRSRFRSIYGIETEKPERLSDQIKV